MLKHLLALIFIFQSFFALAQKIDAIKKYSKSLTYKEYLSQATKTNLLLAAEKYKVSEAEARIALAKIFPEPQLTIGNASGDITGQKLQQQFFVGINQTIPRGGKYKLGIQIAKTEKDLQLALYEDYLRVFKLDVTKRFINVLIAQMDYEKNRNTNELLQKEFQKKIASGEIKGIELYRIEIETGQIQDQLYQSQAELDEALYELYIPLADFDKDSSLTVKGSLNIPFKKFNFDSILPLALENRTDIVLAKKRYQLSLEHQKLAKASRRKNFSFTLGNNAYTEATNFIAPTPAYNAITALFSFPIAWSNLKREDLKIAELQRKEAENERSYILNLIEIEINQSYDRYLIADKQLQIYGAGLVLASDKVLAQELDNYKSGKSSFLDLSESHRKLDEVYRSYFRSLKTYIYCLIELEDDMGIWDLEFK